MGEKTAKSERQRRRMLDASLGLFVRRGYHGTTVRDIAAALGISAGLIFHYFEGKEAILEELVGMAETGVEPFIRLLTDHDDPLAAFDETARLIFASFGEEETRLLFLLINQVITFESIPATAKGKLKIQSLINAGIPLIATGQERGLFASGDPLSISMAFWATIHGIAEALTWFPEAPIPDYRRAMGVLLETRQ